MDEIERRIYVFGGYIDNIFPGNLSKIGGTQLNNESFFSVPKCSLMNPMFRLHKKIEFLNIVNILRL